MPAQSAGNNARLQGGVNLAGAEFGKVPGIYGRDYSYPGASHVDYFADLGFQLLRIPFRWERLQPAPFGDLAVIELDRLQALVTKARSRGLTVVLDPHNYAKRYLADDGWRREYILGQPALPVEAFSNFWRKLAQHFSQDGGIWFGLMNEPNDIALEVWRQAVNLAIAAIRAEGARNLVLVPGINWTGAHFWIRSGNEGMTEIHDPENNFAFEVHQYFDRNSSGTSPLAMSRSIGSKRISDFEDWARKHGFRAFLGEFGFANIPVAMAAARDLLNALHASPDVWIGWAAWAAGPGWPDDSMFLLEPYPDGSIRPQTKLLSEYARR